MNEKLTDWLQEVNLTDSNKEAVLIKLKAAAELITEVENLANKTIIPATSDDIFYCITNVAKAIDPNETII